MRILYTFLFIGLSLLIFGQQLNLVVFDLENNTIDTLPFVDIDTTVQSEVTPFSFGSYNQDINWLEEDYPIDNVYENTDFSLKSQVSLDYDISEYPIRTAIKMFTIVDDSLSQMCSGTMISRKHVLTAAHCAVALYGNEDTLLSDSFYVAPVFDNGEFHPVFDGSLVSKVYVFDDFSYSTDIAVLELKDPIGEGTGWQSIGFQNNDSLLLDGMFYKFSYPGTTLIQIDPNEYNGDTLYYNYGKMTMIEEDYVGVYGATGISGESGSAISKIENNNFYTIYGVLSYSINLMHSRVTRDRFYPIASIIKDDMILGSNTDEFIFSIYPNPISDYLFIENTQNIAFDKLILFNNLGQIVFEKNILSQHDGEVVNLDFLVSGFYNLLLIKDENVIYRQKILKQ